MTGNFSRALIVLFVAAVAGASDLPRRGETQFFRAPDYRDFDEWESAWLVARMRFVDASNGWIVTNGPAFRSRNGGETWERLDDWRPIYADSVWFLDGQRGWMADATGPLMTTTDGGTNWESASPPIDEWDRPGFVYPPSFFRFKDSQRGWGWDDPDLVATTDGGRTWKKIATLPKDHIVADICFSSGGQVYAAGLRMAQNGRRADELFVRRLSTGTPKPLLEAKLKRSLGRGARVECFEKGGQLWAAAPEGTAYSSKDGGAHWENLHLIRDGLLHVQDDGNQWVLGESLIFLGPGRIEGDRLSGVENDGAAGLSFTKQKGRRKALFLNGHSLTVYDLD